MAPKIDVMLVSPDTMTKGGGQHVFSFLICALNVTYKVKRITEILS